MTDATLASVQGFLGLCGRAGQAVLGQEACVEAVRSETVAVVLLDESSSPASLKRFTDSCATHHVPLYGMPAGFIARAVGKDGRMSVALKRGGMAKRMMELLRQERPLAGADT